MDDDLEKQNRISVLYCLSLFAEAIKDYVDDEFVKFHHGIVNKMQFLKTTCSLSCSVIHKQCVSKWCATCQIWRTTILSCHRHRNKIARNKNLDWSFVDSSKWPMDPYEVQKCFYPEWSFDKYSRKTNDCDELILITTMCNCLHFIQNTSQIRTIRNEVHHNYRLDENGKNRYCKELIIFLNSPDIRSYTKAKAACKSIDCFIKKTYEEMLLQKLIDEKRLENVINRNCHQNAKWMVLPITTILVTIIAVILANDKFSSVKTEKGCDLGYRLSFDMYLSQYKEFIGRQWLYEGINSRLESSRGVLLIADHGYGKSAAIANLIIREKGLLYNMDVIYHICRHDVFEFQRADKFILNLVQNIYCMHPAFDEVLKNSNISLQLLMDDIKQNCKFDPFECFDKLLLQPLSRLTTTMDERIVIVVDAIDECSTFGVGYSVLSLLHSKYEAMPEWIKFVFTTKNNTSVIRSFSNLSHWYLLASSDNNKKDIRRYRLNKNIQAFGVNDVIHVIQWNFVVLKYIQSITSGGVSLMTIGVPKTINEMLHYLFRDLYSNYEDPRFQRIRIILEIITASSKPISKKELFQISKFSSSSFTDESDFDMAVESVNKRLQNIGIEDIVFCPCYLHTWLISKHEFYINPAYGHLAIAKYMLTNLTAFVSRNDEDSIYWYLVHLFVHIRFSSKLIRIHDMHSISSLIDRTFCRNYLDGSKAEPCHSVLEMFASVVDSFKLTKKCIEYSHSNNFTIAALNSIIMNNSQSFKAFVKFGYVDFDCYIDLYMHRTFLNVLYDKMGNFVTIDQFTLLHTAIARQNFQVFQILNNASFDIGHIKTLLGYTNLELAVKHDNLEIFSFLYKNRTLFLYKNLLAGPILLHMAAFSKAYRILQYLLELGIRDFCGVCKPFFPPQQHVYSYTPFRPLFLAWDYPPFFVLRKGYYSLLKELTCESILHYAVRVADTTIVESFIKYNSTTLECMDFQGLTPLAGTIVFQRPKLYTYLLNNGANKHFRCKPVNVEKRIRFMTAFQIFDTVYTDNTFCGLECCPLGSSIGHLVLRWPTCAFVESFLNNTIRTSIWYHKDHYGRMPLHHVICNGIEAFYNKAQKIFLFMIFTMNKDYDASTVMNALQICSNNDTLEIGFEHFPFKDLMQSSVCNGDGHLKLQNLRLKIYSVNMSRFRNLISYKLGARYSYYFLGNELSVIFPIAESNKTKVEVYHLDKLLFALYIKNKN